MITTDDVCKFVIDRENGKHLNRGGFNCSEKEYWILFMLDAEKFINFIWRDIRLLNKVSASYMDISINVMYMAGRVVITFSDGKNQISFMGARDLYDAGLHSCRIEEVAVKSFLDRIESFVNAFTPECFLPDESLTIA